MGQFLGFGDGSDGDLVISANTTDAPIDSACTGTLGNKTLSATNASFVAGQLVMIIQMYGAGAGQWEMGQIASYVAGTITLQNNKVFTYVTGAQVLVFKQYNSVTINSGKTLTAKSYTGTVGGVLAYLVKTKVTGPGNIAHNGVTGVGSSPSNNNITTGGGFRGGGGWRSSSEPAFGGDGTGQLRAQANPIGNEGGPGRTSGGDSGGGGGGHANSGVDGSSNSGTGGNGGFTAGSSDLVTMVMGGGGGGGRTDDAEGGHGGSGGGIIYICCDNWGLTGTVNINGGNGYAVLQASGGGGAAGSFLLKARVATLGSSLITALGGTGGSMTDSQSGGNGGGGRIRVESCSITGDSNPSASQSAGGQTWCASNSAIL